MEKPHTSSLEDRLESLGWGLLFLLVAGLALPHGVWQQASVTGVGLLILALNGYRATARLEVSWFGIVLGASCAIAGGAALAGLHADLFVVFFTVAGLVTMAAALLPRPARAN